MSNSVGTYDINIGEVIQDDLSSDMKIMTDNGLVGITTGNNGIISMDPYSTISNATISISSDFEMDDFLDRYSFNKFTVDHKVAQHEFMKLKETVPTYADEIKENLSKNLARDIIKKATFTKKVDKDADVQHFIGRAWVFTESELKEMILEARNVK